VGENIFSATRTNFSEPNFVKRLKDAVRKPAVGNLVKRSEGTQLGKGAEVFA
jgi:hypothetical protein